MEYTTLASAVLMSSVLLVGFALYVLFVDDEDKWKF
jgi:hypothetical protein